MNINWKQLLNVTETTAVSALAAFLAALTQSGATLDAKHLEAAAIGALIGFGYKMSGILSVFVTSTSSTSDSAIEAQLAQVVTALQTSAPAPAPAPAPIVAAPPAPVMATTTNPAPTSAGQVPLPQFQ
jgi:hypothetical protein